MRESPDMLGEVEAIKYGPARRIQAIATNLFAWKFFPLKNERSQTG
jgi:hypothetical protein